MAPIMYHYEAVLRKSMQGKTFDLKDFYKSDHIGQDFITRVVSVEVPPAVRLVEFVDNFDDMDIVLKLLRTGYIVVSRQHGEVGIEYLSPFLEDGALLVACVQCKFVRSKEKWSDIKTRMESAVKELRKRNIDHFPVVYTTSDQKKITEKITHDGIYFTETDIFSFTSRIGILRLHTQKLGRVLSKKYPFLSGTWLPSSPKVEI